MSDEFNTQDELEYNDGLGDLLKEKDRLQFSWAKTATVLAGILAITVFVFWGIFKLASSPKQSEKVLEEISTEIVEEITPKEDPAVSVDEKLDQANEKNISEMTTPVKKEKVETPSTPVYSSKKVYHRVYVGYYQDRANALELVDILKNSNIDSFIWESSKNGQKTYIVQAGSFKTRDLANKQASRIKKKGIDSYVVSSEK